MSRKSVNGHYWQTPPLERGQTVLFQTSLEDRIPSDHPVRMLDEILDRLDWTDWENTYDRRKGQPPIHPSVLCKALLFTMTRRIRSSRTIEYNINHSIDFMWLVSGRNIDHTTLSEFRRNHLHQIKGIHRQMIRTAMDARRMSEGKDPKENPAQLPKTDLDARILPNKEGGYAPNYTPMCLNDMLNGFIVEADVVIGNVEHTCMTTMVDTVSSEFNIHVNTVMADSAYSCGENLTAMEERGIEILSPLAEKKHDNNPALRDDPTVPVADEDASRLPINASSKVLDKQAFVYDAEQDCYFCPMGRKLSRHGQENKKRGDHVVLQIVYRCGDCTGCPLASKCRRTVDAKQGREATHDEHEDARRRHRVQMKTPESQTRYKARQHFGETPFAVLKACFDMRRFLLRGHEGVRTEFQWGCTAFNLKKMMTLVAGLRAADANSVETTV